MSKQDQHKLIVLGALMAVLIAVIYLRFRTGVNSPSVIRTSSGNDGYNVPSLSIPGLTYTPSNYGTGNPMYSIPTPTIPGENDCCDSCSSGATTGGIVPFSLGDLADFLKSTTDPAPTIQAVQQVKAVAANPPVQGTPWNISYTRGNQNSGPGTGGGFGLSGFSSSFGSFSG